MTRTEQKSLGYKEEPGRDVERVRGEDLGYCLEMKDLGYCLEMEFGINFKLYQCWPSMRETDMRCQPLPLDQLFFYLSMAPLCPSLGRGEM